MLRDDHASFKRGDVVFMRSECGDIDHNKVPFNKLCMVIYIPQPAYLLTIEKTVPMVLIEKQLGITTGLSYVEMSDLILFEPNVK